MATDVNTRLSNIETNISGISNYVNRLVTIYSGGGVPNPDLAVLKAELQAWVDTKLGEYVTRSSAQDITATKTFIGIRAAIILKNNSLDYENLNSGTTSTYHSIAWVGKNDRPVGSIFSQKNDSNKTSYLAVSIYGVNSDNTEQSYYFGFRASTDGSSSVGFYIPNFFAIVSESDYNQKRDLYGVYVPNLNWLANTNNFLVHKFGNEEVNGKKTFVAGGTFLAHKSISNDITTYPTTDSEARIAFLDKNDIWTAGLISHYGPQIYTFSMYVPANIHNSNKASYFNITVDDNGYARANIVANKVEISGSVVPKTTNYYNIGEAALLWQDIFASNGTIQTSDENLKTSITDIPEAVLRAWGKVKFQQFQFKDAVEKKGSNARIHMGVIAQRIKEAFQSEGLDARRYGLFCWDEWVDQYEYEQILVSPEEKGMVKVIDRAAEYEINFDGTYSERLISPEQSHMEEQVIKEAVYRTEKKLVQPAGSRYSVRYDECLALECAYQRWQLNLIKQKLGM